MKDAVFGTHPFGTTFATDEVIDAIADIEMQRRETEKEAGFAMSCGSALHRLHELLAHETDALRLDGPGTGHSADIEALTSEISKVKRLAGSTTRPSLPDRPYTRQQKVTRRDTPRNPARNRGRRTMGRASGR